MLKVKHEKIVFFSLNVKKDKWKIKIYFWNGGQVKMNREKIIIYIMLLKA